MHDPPTSPAISTATCDPPAADGPTEAALAAALEWMTAGHDGARVREALASLHPRANPDAVLSLAVATLRDDGNLDPALLRGWALRCYRDIYRRQIEIGDFDGARKTLKELVALAK